MNRRQLGNTDLVISPVGIGTWAVGGDNWQFGWGSQEDDDSVAAIRRALDHGINWIDTAAAYGFGHAEEVVARALKGAHERPFVFTKGSLVEATDRKVTHSLKRASLRAEVEASLRRLQVDTIDLYQIHWPIPDEDLEEGWGALLELKQEGKLRHIGVSNFTVAQLQRAQSIAPVETVQPPYSLVVRDAEAEVFPFADTHGIGVIVYAPMGSGRLTGKMTHDSVAQLPENDWRRNDAKKRFEGAELARALAYVDRLREVAERHSTVPGSVAIAWALSNPSVTGAIVGFRHPGQVDELMPAAMELELACHEASFIETAPDAVAAEPTVRPSS